MDSLLQLKTDLNAKHEKLKYELNLQYKNHIEDLLKRKSRVEERMDAQFQHQIDRIGSVMMINNKRLYNYNTNNTNNISNISNNNNNNNHININNNNSLPPVIEPVITSNIPKFIRTILDEHILYNDIPENDHDHRVNSNFDDVFDQENINPNGIIKIENITNYNQPENNDKHVHTDGRTCIHTDLDTNTNIHTDTRNNYNNHHDENKSVSSTSSVSPSSPPSTSTSSSLPSLASPLSSSLSSSSSSSSSVNINIEPVNNKKNKNKNKNSFGLATYKCNDCSFQSKWKQNLKRHLKIHKGTKEFKCHMCAKQFGQKSNLTVHIRTHTGERPFKCNQCHKQFITSSNYKTHLRNKHPLTQKLLLF